MIKKTEKKIGERTITLETGKLAKQANGSVVLQCGDTILLATVVMSKKKKEGLDFFPLTVEYAEKMYAAGKIPGGFFKRESRPSVAATLTARLIDRPLRPNFPKNIYNEVQVIITTLSNDNSFAYESLGIVAASAALSISDVPFNCPVGAALVGCIDGKLKINPSITEMENSTLNIIVAGTKEAILMVEADAKEVSEEIVIEAINFAHQHIKEIVELQEELVAQAGKEKIIIEEEVVDVELQNNIKNQIENQIEQNLKSGNKQQIEDFLENLEKEVLEKFIDAEKTNEALVKKTYQALKKEKIRDIILTQKIRPDGRSLDEIRKIDVEVDLLPSAHGSALFTRGETQSLGVVTLGGESDSKIEENLNDVTKKKYYLHYNFPPFSVGEVGRLSTGRRELGHGMLAQRALQYILPTYEEFPYTLRLVSEILESNGSSSMASVCSGALALMDCGVPIKSPVSGIAMGLLIKDDNYTILSDIQGLEDHYGDMDFKVTGTKKGITALQLDIKVAGLSEKILKESLYQAQKGRLFILDKMLAVLDQPRANLASNAPHNVIICIPHDKVGLVIGPGGKTIKNIESESNASVAVTDTDKALVTISAQDEQGMKKAKSMIEMLTHEVKIGDSYDGKVVKITNFGAFIELYPGKEALLHISKIAKHRIEKVEDELSLNERIKVSVLEIDDQNRIKLERI